MSRIKKNPAISLRNVRIRETSLLITFFTRDFGKVKAIAKGVRTKDSRLLRAYEPCVLQVFPRTLPSGPGTSYRGIENHTVR